MRPLPPPTRELVERFAPAVGAFVALKTIALIVFLELLSYSGDYLTKEYRFGGGAKPRDVLASWDGWWYLQVAEHGYHPALVTIPGTQGALEQNSAAFFPLYPALLRAVAEVTPFGLYGAGMIVSILASLAAAAGIYAVVELLASRRAGIIAACLWAIAPGSGVEWAVYSDSLFVALAAWACYCVMTRRWVSAGVLAMVAGLGRPTAAALIGAVGLAAIVALVRREPGTLRQVAAMALAPLGLLGYLAWFGWKAGQWNAYAQLERHGWQHYFDGGKATWAALRHVVLGRYDNPAWIVSDIIATLLIIALPALLFLMARLRLPLVLMAFTLATVVLTLGSQGIYSNTSRYLLAAFPLVIPLAWGLRRVSWTTLVPLLALGAMASAWFAGYVIFELGVP